VLVDALRSANWHIRGESQYGTLWNGGRGIMVHHAATATAAATALINALGKEGLPVNDAGDSPSGLPVHIAFRRPYVLRSTADHDAAWLLQEIVPKLDAYSLSRIAKATGLSLAASSRIRSGTRSCRCLSHSINRRAPGLPEF
jgi:hypothetical protein